MEKISKGEITKKFILSEAGKVYNENGINLTIKELSERMNITVSKITNHFPTRDHLFVGISKQYQEELLNLRSSYNWNNEYTLQKLYDLTGLIMDLQYNYRCLMLFVCATGINQKLMLKQITESWNDDQTRFKALIDALIYFDLLSRDAAKGENYSILQFQFINLFTTWLVPHTIYDTPASYVTMKPVYQKGILMSLHPFLTEKGKIELLKIK